MRTKKQQFAQESNWRMAQIKGCSAVLKGIAKLTGMTLTAEKIEDIQHLLEEANRDYYKLRKP